MKKLKISVSLTLALMLLASCGTEPGFSVSDGTDETSQTEGDVTSGTDNESEFIPTDAEAYDYMANDLSGFIKLGEYKNIAVTKESPILRDEEFENEIDAMLENYSYYAEETDRQVEEGDTVLADFAGYLDGVQFDGGTAENQTITAAANSGYIEGFAEAFIGQMPGVEFDFNVTFPAEYGNADLAGKEVTFVCTIHSIRGDEIIVPELTDEFVMENFGYSNVDEFKIAYRGTVEDQKAYYVESNMHSQLWATVVDNAEVIEYPGEEVDRIYSERRTMYESYAQYYQVDYETFLTSYMNITDETLYDECRSYVKEDLVMYQLIKELGISLTEADYDEGMQFLADYYGAAVEDLTSYYGEETLRTTILWQALMENIAEYAVITEE